MVAIKDLPRPAKDLKDIWLNGQRVGYVNPKPTGAVMLLYELLPAHLLEVKQAIAVMDAGGDEKLAIDLYDARIIRQAPKVKKQPT